MEADREMEQELEWLEAQKIAVSVDVVAAAKQQLLFLAAVDKCRWLYEGPALDRAIYRYNACWLPLLAKHSESPISEGPLVVPLDCEWVWHCHRLNPVRYKADSEELYGRILDNLNVVSSIKGTCRRQTVEIWNRFYPDEPYDFDFRASSPASSDKSVALEECTKYDLVSAVKRQSPFFYQVSKPHFNHEIFLSEAVARYKGFLHLIKRNRERSIKRFCVPTYDIDLIWHTHQLHPVSYSRDLTEAIGKILEHDDMDSDRTKGKKLDVGFSGTTKQWEETFGRRYWKAGAMYRGPAPAPVTTSLYPSDIMSRGTAAVSDFQKMIQLPEVKLVEVLLEIVGVKNLPDGCKGRLFVTFSKKQPDTFFDVKRKLTILSEVGEKQVASFQCEPKGELFLELVSQSPSNLLAVKTFKTIGTASLSLENFLNPVSRLSVEKWVELLPNSGKVSSKSACLRIAVSFTVPIQAPHVLHMVRPRSLSNGYCLFQLPGRVQNNKNWTHVNDGTDSEVIRLQMRDSTKAKAKDEDIVKKEVIGLTESGDTRTLAEFGGAKWSLLNSQWCLQRTKKFSEGGHLFELVGHSMVNIFQGRRLDFEPKHFEKRRSEQDFMTAVEFSTENPYGKAVALLDLKSGFVKVKEEWMVMPGIISSFILSATWKKQKYFGLGADGENLEETDGIEERVNGPLMETMQTSLATPGEGKVELKMDAAKGNVEKSSGCGGGCGGGCGNKVNISGSCGGGCGGGCGNMEKSGGCGGGCGGECGNTVNNSKCGGGCGSGCGSMGYSGKCGSGCGGGCGNMVKSNLPAANSCIDNCLKELPIRREEAQIA